MGWLGGGGKRSRRGEDDAAASADSSGAAGDAPREIAVAEVLPPVREPLAQEQQGRTFDAEGRVEDPGPRGGAGFSGTASVQVRGCAPMLIRGVVALAGIGLMVALVLLGLGLAGWSVGAAADWLRGQGEVGKIAVVLGVALATPLMLPSGLLAVLPGYVFGSVWGTALVVVGAAMGGVINMFLARWFLRGRLAQAFLADPRVQAVRQRVAAEGFRLALGLRLSPVAPYALLAYAAGAIGMPVRHFALASLIGGVPWTAVYASVGALLAETGQAISADAAPAGPWVVALRVAGLLLTVAVAIGRIIRRATAL